MAKLFSFASWNVEHFKNDEDRVDLVFEFIAAAAPDHQGAPDIFGIYEVEGRQVFNKVVEKFPTHSFFITEADITQNILVGVNRSIPCFVTQREKLKSGVASLRPGALATLTIGNEIYSILFLHLKADDAPRSWGLRDDMTTHIQSLKKKLDEKSPSSDGSNMIVIGDLNNVGMNLTYSDKDFTELEELDRYSARFSARNLRLLIKTSSHTFWNGSRSSTPKANLDHVYASSHIKFRRFGAEAEILVKGWPEYENVDDQNDFIATHSDHALLYGEVQQ